jgi:hypothetical protein
MGTQLDAVDAGGDADRVWVNMFRIFTGRLDELRLTLDGAAHPPPHSVRTASIFPLYAHLLLELQIRWQTRPFPFDWRIDIDQSASALAELVRSWGAGEPVHLLAHSMGGLDEAVSGPGKRRHLVITDQARRGILHGGLGGVAFFPWGRRVVAVAGTGHAGTFGEPELRRLARNLTWAVAGLPAVRTICTVLIGSGEGTLEIEPAVRWLFRGVADALAEAQVESPIRLLRIVEKKVARAQRIRAAMEDVRRDPDVARQIELSPAEKIRPAPGGAISVESGLALLVAAAARASTSPARSAARKAVGTLLRALPRQDALPARLVKTLVELGQNRESDLGRMASSLRVRLGPPRAPSGTIATRVSFVRASDRIRVAAITETATVAERDLGVDFALVEELVGQMTDPLANRLDDLADLLRRLLLPADFDDKVREGPPLVFEVDRALARVHWEMMAGDDGGAGAPRAPGLRTAIARQLRTTYSPPPAPAPRPVSRLRALVVGDPGGPTKGDSLPGARREAQRVAELLRARRVDVVELIGAPDAAGAGPLPGISPATRTDVLHHLLTGGFDLLHYCGHGDFDPDEPDRAGWVFKGGLLTSRELEGMALAPRLVVANAASAASRPPSPAPAPASRFVARRTSFRASPMSSSGAGCATTSARPGR